MGGSSVVRRETCVEEGPATGGMFDESDGDAGLLAANLSSTLGGTGTCAKASVQAQEIRSDVDASKRALGGMSFPERSGGTPTF
jgi:hypothetical protein